MSGVCQCQPEVSVSTQTGLRSGGRREVTATHTSQPVLFFFFCPLLKSLPSPSVSGKLRVPPPANKAIRDGKDADTAAFERHSEQKRTRGRRGEQDREGIKTGGWRGGKCLLWLSVRT